MVRVRRRARIMDVVQFDGTDVGMLRAETLCGPALSVNTAHSASLHTSRGILAVMRGDWLIRDPDSGEILVRTGEQFFRDFDHVPAREPA